MRSQGLTLTELLIATILVSIVLVGVASFSASVKQMQDQISKITLLIMRTTSAMSHIERTVTQTVGDQNDPGIVTGVTNGNDWIAFRLPQGELDTYDDDTWIIYIEQDRRNRLVYCEQSESEGGADPNQNTCVNNRKVISQDIEDATFQTVFPDGVSNDFYVSITLATRYDPENPSNDIIQNPEYTLTTNISPVSHSW